MHVLYLRNIKNLSMTKEELLSKLKVIIEPYVQNQEGLEKLSGETNFIDDLEINSANLVDIILDVEDEFDIEIDNDGMDKMLTVNASIEVIQDKLGIT